MCKSNDYSDYSLRTANTGIASINTANSQLDGSGTITTVFTAGQLGAIVKSVTVKAVGAVTTGIVRLFIQSPNPAASFLYKEVRIPITPVLSNTGTPTPVLPLFETVLTSDLKLEAGYKIGASTQVGDAFNIIVEGLDWEYPVTLPNTCCNFKQVSAVTGRNIVNVANPNTDGSGAKMIVFTAPASGNSNGSFIKNITIKALGSTSINGMIRLFVSGNGGNDYFLMREISVPQTTQSAYEPSFKHVIKLNYYLQANYIIAASTQNAESFALTVEAEEWNYPI